MTSENDRPSVLHAELTFNGEGVLLEGNRHKFGNLIFIFFLFLLFTKQTKQTETLNDFLKTYSEILTTPWCPSWTDDITVKQEKK